VSPLSSCLFILPCTPQQYTNHECPPPARECNSSSRFRAQEATTGRTHPTNSCVHKRNECHLFFGRATGHRFARNASATRGTPTRGTPLPHEERDAGGGYSARATLYAEDVKPPRRSSVAAPPQLCRLARILYPGLRKPVLSSPSAKLRRAKLHLFQWQSQLASSVRKRASASERERNAWCVLAEGQTSEGLSSSSRRSKYGRVWAAERGAEDLAGVAGGTAETGKSGCLEIA